MIDLSKLDPADAERIAYAEGFTGVAALYARLSDAEHLNSANEDELDKLRDRVSDLEAEIENLKDTLIQCLPFFEDRKEKLGSNAPRTMDFMIRLIRQALGETD